MKNSLERLATAVRGLGYDDVMLAPRVSDVDPKTVDLTTQLGPIRLATPLVAASMIATSSEKLCVAIARSGGIGIIPQWPLHRRLSALIAIKKQEVSSEGSTFDDQGRYRVAVSFAAQDLDKVPDFIAAGADAVVLESAHAGSSSFLDAASMLRTIVPQTVALMAGNVADAETAERLRGIGVDAVKVGVGVGAVCTTTEVTGVGMPQITAIAEVSDTLEGSGIAIIADGGIRQGGDIVKSFCAGAAAACIGSLFAQAHEAAGETYKGANGQLLRKYSANFYPSLAYMSAGRFMPGEGLEGWIPVTSELHDIVAQLSTAARVGMAYIGASTIAAAVERARFVLQLSPQAELNARRHLTNLVPLSGPELVNSPAAILKTRFSS